MPVVRVRVEVQKYHGHAIQTFCLYYAASFFVVLAAAAQEVASSFVVVGISWKTAAVANKSTYRRPTYRSLHSSEAMTAENKNLFNLRTEIASLVMGGFIIRRRTFLDIASLSGFALRPHPQSVLMLMVQL